MNSDKNFLCIYSVRRFISFWRCLAVKSWLIIYYRVWIGEGKDVTYIRRSMGRQSKYLLSFSHRPSVLCNTWLEVFPKNYINDEKFEQDFNLSLSRGHALVSGTQQRAWIKCTSELPSVTCHCPGGPACFLVCRGGHDSWSSWGVGETVCVFASQPVAHHRHKGSVFRGCFSVPRSEALAQRAFLLAIWLVKLGHVSGGIFEKAEISSKNALKIIFTEFSLLPG